MNDTVKGADCGFAAFTCPLSDPPCYKMVNKVEDEKICNCGPPPPPPPPKKKKSHTDFGTFRLSLMSDVQAIKFIIFTPQPLRAFGVLFSPMVSGWAGVWVGRRREIVCPGCISETVRCGKLILGRDIG